MNSFEQGMGSIVAALDAFEASLSPDRPLDLASFIQGRVTLSRAVKQFLANEWDNLPQNADCGNGSDRQCRTAIHNALVSLRADYSRHVVCWDSASLVKNWPGYRRDCQHLIGAMRRLLEVRAAGATLRAA